MMDDALILDDCWNRIGVRGDHSCERLASQQHCRHCPVHEQAAHRIMQRRALAGAAEEWALLHAAPAVVEATGTQSQMVFRIGREWLCLPTALCLQIAEPAPVHVLPHRSNALLAGVVNVDGRLRPQLSLAALLGIDPQPSEAASRPASGYVYPRLLLLRVAGDAVATPVAEVHGIARIDPDASTPLPATVGATAAFLRGMTTVGALRVGVLDGELVTTRLGRALR